MKADKVRTRRQGGVVARWQRPAKAGTAYALTALLALAFVLIAVLYVVLLHRTRAVCDPLRFGQQAGQHATTTAGKDFARTFGGAADRLGCKR